MTDEYKKIESLLDKLQSEIITHNKKYLESSINILANYYQTSEKYSNILKDYHWTPFARTYRNDMDSIIAITEERTTKKIKEQKISEYFITRLNSNNYEYLNFIFDSWCKVKELNNRIHILKEIIAAYKSGYYSLMIPVSISQIEGIIAEYNNHIGDLYNSKTKEYFAKLFSLHGKVNNDNPANIFILDLLYDRFVWGDGKNHEISRHAILHGENVTYNTLQNAVKIIQLVDYIIYIAYILEKEI